MRILVIEDDECVAETLKLLMVKHTYSADVALNG
ncbi:MAG: response regulator [Leptolyngbyaceae cyanobacterium SM2_5_2]|nr:response regulator [Leptolyngbyaceae cyanobacterium SM2_5_2]